ncbi:MAG: hypothetical protein ACXW3F_13350 [Pyrinomonadaceae bacterium]
MICNPKACDQLALENVSWRQLFEYFAGRARVDALELLIEIMHVQEKNFVGLGTTGSVAAHFDLVKQIVTLVDNQTFTAEVAVAHPELQLESYLVRFYGTIPLLDDFSG